METDPAKKKLRRGRTMLILGDGDEPFFGSVAIGLDLIEDKRCPTASTDGKSIRYNPDWILTLDAEETMALFEHEVYHVALKHGSLVREIMDEPNFNNALWQKACDEPINERLIAKGRKLPATPSGYIPVLDPKFSGMSAIRIYRMLQDERKQAQQQACPGGSSTPQNGQSSPPCDDPAKEDPNGKNDSKVPSEDKDTKVQPDKPKELIEDTGGFGGILPLTDDKGTCVSKEIVEEAERKFEMVIMNSARILEKSLESKIGDMPGFIKEIIKAHTEPQRTYKDEILDIMEEITRDDYSWERPNRKYDIYLPSLYSKKLAELVVIVDSSGSVSNNELKIYAGEISGILEEFEGLQVHVIFHHMQVYHIETYTSDDFPITFGNLLSGGTDYKDAYNKIEQKGYDPKVILHFTDLDVYKTSYPEKEPEYPVFWMNTTPRKSNGALRYSKPPWGRIIDLDPYI